MSIGRHASFITTSHWNFWQDKQRKVHRCSTHSPTSKFAEVSAVAGTTTDPVYKDNGNFTAIWSCCIHRHRQVFGRARVN